MTTHDDPVEYPASWRPKGAPADDHIDPTAAELWLASLSDDEYAAMTRRVRGER